MSEMIKEFKKGDLLYIEEDGKAQWGFPDGYPYKEDNRTIIEWDGNTNGKETFGFGNISDPFKFYKVSDATMSVGDLLGAAVSFYFHGIPYGFEVTSNLIMNYTEQGCIMIMNAEAKQIPNIVVILDSDKMADSGSGINVSEGIYFLSNSDYFINMLTYGSETIHPMATVFLPQATSATPGTVKQMPYLPNATDDAPTAENFNQLVRELESAGLMRRS